MEHSTAAYSKSLQLFQRYFKYVVIIGLSWALKHQTDRSETLEKEKSDLMQKDINEKADAIKAWQKTKENDNEILEKLLNRIEKAEANRKQHD